MKERFKGTVLGLALLATLASPGSSSAAVVAEGTWAVGGGGSCLANPSCLAFVQTCDPTLAIQDGVQTSIVDVASSAGRDRTFSWDGTGTVPQDASIHFLSATCATAGTIAGERVIPQQEGRRIRVPVGTKWMAVTSGPFVTVNNSFTLSV